MASSNIIEICALIRIYVSSPARRMLLGACGMVIPLRDHGLVSERLYAFQWIGSVDFRDSIESDPFGLEIS